MQAPGVITLPSAMHQVKSVVVFEEYAITLGIDIQKPSHYGWALSIERGFLYDHGLPGGETEFRAVTTEYCV